MLILQKIDDYCLNSLKFLYGINVYKNLIINKLYFFIEIKQ